MRQKLFCVSVIAAFVFLVSFLILPVDYDSTMPWSCQHAVTIPYGQGQNGYIGSCPMSTVIHGESVMMVRHHGSILGVAHAEGNFYQIADMTSALRWSLLAAFITWLVTYELMDKFALSLSVARRSANPAASNPKKRS